jgi:hypothetical protein
VVSPAEEYSNRHLAAPRCSDGRRLLDAYLIALTDADLSRTEKAQRNLLLVRRKYWTDVNRHHCRKAADLAYGSGENQSVPWERC